MGIGGNAGITVSADDMLSLSFHDSMFGEESKASLGVSLADVLAIFKFQKEHAVVRLFSPGDNGLWSIKEGMFYAQVGERLAVADGAFFNELSSCALLRLRTLVLHGSPAGEVEFRPHGQIWVTLDRKLDGWGLRMRYPKLLEAIKTGIPYHGDECSIVYVDNNVQTGVIMVKHTAGHLICLSAEEVLSGLSLPEESDKI